MMNVRMQPRLPQGLILQEQPIGILLLRLSWPDQILRNILLLLV